MIRVAIALVVVVLACAPLAAEEPAGFTTRGPIRSARLVALANSGGLTLEIDGNRRTVSSSELVSWGRLAPIRRGPVIVLADGSELVADPLAITADECRVDSRLVGELSLPRSAVRGIVWRLPADLAQRDRLLDRIARHDEPHDLLLLANGDELTGKVQRHQYDAELGEERLSFVPQGGSDAAQLGISKVAALALDSVTAPRSAPRGKHWLAGLRDGSRLVVTSLADRRAGSELTLAGGVKIILDADALPDDLVAWQPMGQGVLYVSDLETTGYKHIPFLTQNWPYENDRNCLGSRLRAAGAVYAKGIGMHTTSRLAYDLPPGYRAFQAELAIDEAAGAAGSVIFRVFVDSPEGAWQVAYESPVIRGGDAPLPISIDLKQAKRLVLIVEFAERGDELDHANWLHARLVK